MGEKDWLTLEEVFPDSHAGDRIKGLRYRENMTQKQLADLAGISVQNLSHMEHGRRAVGKEMAKRLAKALNADWRTLLAKGKSMENGSKIIQGAKEALAIAAGEMNPDAYAVHPHLAGKVSDPR